MLHIKIIIFLHKKTFLYYSYKTNFINEQIGLLESVELFI